MEPVTKEICNKVTLKFTFHMKTRVVLRTKILAKFEQRKFLRNVNG